ncbi:thermosome subunit [Ignisphaera aggregans DSM 17230]|uniref:Thermosome subunit n=1 Tax=Ignisphaera aggregans (strain DSM 17230 / JCM 13409 / AQ1.S1) TaxID=583356 RepID=E0SP65_IGNAA|nr:thermosome subunit [Ignisphaera aggregans DSM 17230]
MALYGVPVLILKEGTSRTHGREALRANIMAARVLSEILKTSLGPRGLDKMLVDSFGDITVTNDGAAIVKEMEVQHPAAKLLVEAAKAVDAEVGDGTTSVVVLSGALLERAEQLLDQGIHPTVIIEGYKAALNKALEILDEIAIKLKIGDLDKEEDRNIAKQELKKALHTALASKYIATPDVLDRLMDMILEAAFTAAEKRPDGTYDVKLDMIKIEKKRGGSLADSMLIQGIVLDKEVVHPAMPRRVENAKIALLDTPLEIEKPDITAKINITSPEQIRSFLEEEAKILRDMVEKISSVGANVVICQKGIDDVAQHYLAKKGIMAVRRVKRSDMEKLEKATGGRIVTSVRDLTERDLGSCELVEERRVGNDKMVFVERCKNPKAATILLRGANDMLLDEVERSINDGLHTIRNLLRDPKVVPGGGAVEIELAMRLRKWAESVGGREQLAVMAFADAIEEIPQVLAQTAGMDVLETIMELRKLHAEGKQAAGIDVVNSKVIDDITKINVLEPVAVKKQILKSATETATTILKIDDVIAAAPKKEEKGKKEEKKEEEEEKSTPKFD